MAKTLKTRRILKTKEFQDIFNHGTKSVFPELVFISQSKERRDYSRIGIIVSKKVSKKAVERNKVKRRLREVFRKLDKPFSALSCDTVVIARNYAKHATYQRLLRSSNRGLFKIKTKQALN